MGFGGDYCDGENSNLTDDQLQILKIVGTISASLSVIAVVIFFISFFRSKHMRTYFTQYVAILATYDLLYALSWFPFAVNSVSCTVQGFGLQTFLISTYMCTVCMALVLVYSVVKLRRPPRYMLGVVLVSVFVVSVASGVGILFWIGYDCAGGFWCWIDHTHLTARILVYGAGIVMWLFTFACYIGVTVYMLRMEKELSQPDVPSLSPSKRDRTLRSYKGIDYEDGVEPMIAQDYPRSDGRNTSGFSGGGSRSSQDSSSTSSSTPHPRDRVRKETPVRQTAADVRRAPLRRSSHLLILFVVTQIPAIMSRVVTAITGREYFVLFLLHVATEPLIGFLNCFIYAFLSKRFWRGWSSGRMRRWFGWCPCCGPMSEAGGRGSEKSDGGFRSQVSELGIPTDLGSSVAGVTRVASSVTSFAKDTVL